MSRRSVFVDRGEEIAVFFPSILHTDRRGNSRPKVGSEGIDVRVTESKDRSSIAELIGAIENKVVKLLIRDLDGARAWDRIEFRGELWDMAAPPFQGGWNKRNSHWEVVLRSRNKRTDVVVDG